MTAIYISIAFMGICNYFLKNKKILYLISCLLIILIVGLRHYEVGTDTHNYFWEFYYIKDYEMKFLLHHRWELGFVFLTKIISLFVTDGYQYLFIASCFFLIPMFLFIYRNSEDPMLSLIVFMATGFFLSSMIIMRQMFALAILYSSIPYIKKKALGKFILIVLLACSFHRTAIVFLPMYYIDKLKLNTRRWGELIAVSVFLGISGDKIRIFLNHFARGIERGNSNGGGTLLLVLWIFIFLTILFAKKDLASSNSDIMLKLLAIGATIQPIVFAFSNWARVVSYFTFSLVIIIPLLVKGFIRHFKNRYFTYVIVNSSVIIILWFWYLMGVSGIAYRFNSFVERIVE